MDLAPAIAMTETRAEVEVFIRRESAFILWASKLVNLFNGGIFLPTSKTIPVGTPVLVTLRFEGALREVRASGFVVWEKLAQTVTLPCGVGVRLCDLGPEDHRFMLGWLRPGADRNAQTEG